MSEPVVDLAGWLTQIWAEQERAAQLEVDLLAEYFPADKGYSWKYRWSRQIWHDGIGPSTSTMPGAPSPTEVLARIAADRQILALHSGSASYCAWTHDDRDTHHDYGPCDTIRLLALPYADRAGYRREWRP